MFKNYFKTAWRNLGKHRLFTGLNVFGLATGMACSILIFLWVADELGFDKFNHDADHIFRITTRISGEDVAVVPPSLAKMAMMLAFFTISFQTIKAAMTNPVKNLRTE